MARWAPDAALRLERAARELFAEQGYAATTVPQIAARAGLTTRSFFRYFQDKREVLFLRQREFGPILSDLMGRAPQGLSAMQLVRHGFAEVTGDFERWRSDLIDRRAIIRSDDHLLERELLKSRMLARDIETALADYGVDAADAGSLAAMAVLVFTRSIDDWLDRTDHVPFPDVVNQNWGRLARIMDAADASE